jgi:hypothetical protein
MTKSDRETLSQVLAAQADVFERIGAHKLARGLRRQASNFAADIQGAFDISPAPMLEPVPARARDRRRH